MHDQDTVVVKESSAGPVAWVVGIAIVVAAVLFVLFYWHPWNMTSTTNSTTTVTQPANGTEQKSNTTSTSNSQPH